MLKLENVTFGYSENVQVIDKLDLIAREGEHIAIIGESGCGKSTLLKLIYGILDTDAGQIRFNGRIIHGPSRKLIPGDDEIKYLAQDFGLMPYITVGENIGKYLSNIYKDVKANRVTELLEVVGMTEFIDIKAINLSGGQQQRTALAMALALAPKLLLLDEPFSQIDAFRTNTLRRAIFEFCKSNAITVITATHDSKDILSFSDKVVVLRNSKILRQGSPEEVYNNPQSFYTASLFGEVSEMPNSLLILEPTGRKTFVYPHQLTISDSGFDVLVQQSYFMGSHYLTEAVMAENTIYFHHSHSVPQGTTVRLSYKK